MGCYGAWWQAVNKPSCLCSAWSSWMWTAVSPHLNPTLNTKMPMKNIDLQVTGAVHSVWHLDSFVHSLIQWMFSEHLPCCCSVAQSCPTLHFHGLQHARPPCPSLCPRVFSNSCPLSQWCHPTISSSVTSFSSYPQSFPASGSFPMSQLFTSGGQSIGASASVLPMNIRSWFPLGWTGLISLLSKGLSSIFSSTTICKHQFFGAQPSLLSNSYISTWLLRRA